MRPDTEYLFTNDINTLENMQTEFNIITFPVDRGTTPDSMVYIYQNNILIRKIPFIDEFVNDSFDLRSLEIKDIEQIIKQELPLPF